VVGAELGMDVESSSVLFRGSIANWAVAAANAAFNPLMTWIATLA
jgi:hypothetical protein